MNRARMAAAVAAGTLAVAGLSAVTATPALASHVCITNSPTPQYQGFDVHIGIGHELTHSEGRGFRVYYSYGGTGMPTWSYGHGAQYPDNPGWVRRDRLRC